MNLPRPRVLRPALVAVTAGAVGAAVLVVVLTRSGDPDPEPGPDAPQGSLSSAAPDVSLRRDPGSVVGSASVVLDPGVLGRALDPGPAGRQRTAALSTTRFAMVAVTWRGALTGELRVRTRHDGRWSAWRDLEPIEDLPDPSSGEGNGLRGTDLTWVGPGDGVQVETPAQRPRELALQLVDPGVLPSDADAPIPAAEPDLAVDPALDPALERSAPAAGAAGAARALARGAGARPLIGYGPLQPPLLGRGRWGADESLRNGSPDYGPRLQQVHIHHTASGNTYAPADVPAQIRGFYRYHTSTLGWSDIGYNFLVDRFGRIWVGRAGGVRRIVMGAHTLGFNSTSTGVAVMGNYETAWPSARVLQSVARLAAWKLNPWRGSQPSSWDWVWSQGSDRYSAGRWVHLPVIDGHRDTNETACPGRNLYARLPWIRTRAQALANAW